MIVCCLVIRFLFTIIIYIYLLLCYAQLQPPGHAEVLSTRPLRIFLSITHTQIQMAFGLFWLPKRTVFCLTQNSEMFCF